MADTVERLYKLIVDGTQAARSLANIERATDNLDKRMAASSASIKAFGAGLAAAVSVGAIVHGIGRIIDSFDELSKQSQKLGVGVEDLQRLRFAADLSGVSSEQLEKALTSVAQAMGNLGEKGDKAAGALRKIGAKEGDSSVEVLKKMADAFKGMDDGMEKTALAADAFGKKVGLALIPMLNEGAEAFEKLMKEADEFGGVVSGATAKSAEVFNDNLSRLQRTAAGVGAQFTSGLLPALQSLSQSFVDSAKKGDGFTSSGEKMGRLLVEISVIGIKAAAVLESLGLIIGATAAAIANPLEAKTIFKLLGEDIDALDKEANEKINRLRESFEKNTAALAAGTIATDKLAEAKRKLNDALKEQDRLEKEQAKREKERAKAEREAEKAQREKEKLQKEAADALLRQIAIEEKLNAIVREQLGIGAEEKNVAAKRIDARVAVTKASEEHVESLQIEEARLDRLVELFETGTPEVKAWAAAQLVATAAAQGATDTFVKERDEMDVLGESFTSFVNAAASSAGHLSDAFKKMTQVILAELLKLWAKRYILQAVAAFMGVDVNTGAPIKQGARGMVLDEGRVVPFARGGIISRPMVFPMAMAGEAGPEAILPLRRALDGNLGVQAQASPLHITVNNYADATVSTRRTVLNELEVLVEKTRAVIANDLRSGGNLVSKSLEQAYGIGRGAAAAF